MLPTGPGPRYSSAMNTRFANVGILLVDDQKAARVLLKSYLARLGFGKIEEATDSIEAVRILAQTPPAQCPFGIAFVSRSMREMSGLDFVRTIRQRTGWGDFPIVLVSEDLNPALVRDAIAAGATDYMLRPYDEKTLSDLLQRTLRL